MPAFVIRRPAGLGKPPDDIWEAKVLLAFHQDNRGKWGPGPSTEYWTWRPWMMIWASEDGSGLTASTHTGIDKYDGKVLRMIMPNTDPRRKQSVVMAIYRRDDR
jgi:hypothetical protein